MISCRHEPGDPAHRLVNPPRLSRPVALALLLGALGLSAVAQTTVTLTDTQDDTTVRDTTANNLTLTVNNADSATHSGLISGTGSLTKDGPGALTLSAANTLTGDTNLTAGTIVLGNSAALATSRLITTAGTTLSFGSLTAATLGGLHNTSFVATGITLENNSSAAVALTVNTNDALNPFHDYYGVLSGSGSLIKTGTEELRLKSTNTYTGGTTLSGGSLRMDDAGALGTTGTISFVGGELTFITADLSSRFSTAAGQNIKVGVTGSGGVTFASNLTSTGGTFEVTAGKLTLTGNNTYSGGTAISGSGTVLILGSSGALPATGNITFNGGALALYDSTDLSSRFSAIAGQAFNIDTNGNNVTFATGLSSASSSSFTKSGAGTLTLTAASTYSGNTSVRGGTLLLGAATTLPSAKNTTVNGDGLNATLDLNGNNLTIGTLSLGGTSAGSSATITTGSGTLTLGGNVTFSASSNPLGATIAGKLELGANRTFTIGNSATAASDLTVSAIISGVGRSITKAGLGTLTLSGANTYTGATLISAGTLIQNGSATGSTFTVNTGGTLAGTGTLGGLTLNSGSFLSPGSSPGTLSAGNTTFAGGATYLWEVNDATGVAGTNWDLLAITGTLTITATSGTPFNLSLKSLTAGDAAGIVPNFNETQNATFVIASTTGGITGFAANAFAINTGGFANAFTGTWSVAANGNNLELNYTAAAIPEPSGLAALAGLAGLGLVLWRRRTARP